MNKFTVKTLHKKSLLWLWVAGLVATGQCAQASDYLDMDLEQLLNVKVTGSTLTDESLISVPSAASVFTCDELNKLGMDYLYELLNLVPGFQVDRAGDSPINYTYSSRGQRNGAGVREILLVVDGQVFNDPRSGTANQSYMLFPLESIEKIEVIRGPGSAIYGSNAFTGVINITTRKKENFVKVDVGSDARKNINLALSNQYGNWESTIFAHAYEDSGQDFVIKDSFTKKPFTTEDPRKMYEINASIGNGDTQVQANVHRAQAEDFYVLEKTSNELNLQKEFFYKISASQRFQPTNSLHTQISVNYIDAGLVSQFISLPGKSLLATSSPASAAPLYSRGTLEGDRISVAVANDWTLSDYASMQFGMEWNLARELDARAYNNFNIGEYVHHVVPVTYYGNLENYTALGIGKQQHSTGFYGQYLRTFDNGIHLTLGGRYDDYDVIGTHFSPRLGIVKQFDDTQSVKLLYGEAYRAPSIIELSQINNLAVQSNPDLTYEIVKTWDLIWMKNWQKYSISIGGFSNNYEDSIVTGFQNSIRTFYNAVDEHSSGMEIEASAQLSEHWLVRATYSHFFALPASAFREADQLGSLMVNYETSRWNFNMAYVMQSQRQELVSSTQKNTLGGFCVLNTKLSYSFKENTELNLQIKNALDKRFSTPAQGAGLPTGVINRGREISAGVKWSF